MDFLYGMTQRECEIAKTIFDLSNDSSPPSSVYGMRKIHYFIRNNDIDISKSNVVPSENAIRYVKECFLDAEKMIDESGLNGENFRELLKN